MALRQQAATPLVTRALLIRFVSIVAGAIGFFLPLSVVPAYADSTTVAGLSTGALLLTTVACELATPRLVSRTGYRVALACGLFLLGAPTLLLLVSASPAVILSASVLRGAGFAVAVVAGGALTASLLPAERRGEGLALVGLVSGVPALLALPLGVWVAGRWGYEPVFIATAVVPLLALATVPALPRDGAGPGGTHGVLAGLRTAALTRPALVFAASAAGAGVLATFLPLALSGAASWLAPVALLAQSATATAAKWWAGKRGDRHGHTGQLVPGLALAAVGLAGTALTSSVPAVLAGAVLFGAGFGILQNATLTLMYTRVTVGGYGTVSAIWNAAYDVGMAVGAIGVGLIVTVTGYPLAFVLVAAAMVPGLAVARRDREGRPSEL